jgi:sarcosine oxidase delta subunit
MSVAFFWCHTWGCPNFGRPRQIATPALITCPYCGAERKQASPDDHAMNTTAPGEQP